MNLTNYVKQVSLEDFGWEFRHQAYWNKRLRTTGDASFPKMAIWILTQKSMKLLGWRHFEKLSAMSWSTIISIISARVTAMEIGILKNYSSRWMACATLLHCPTRKPFSSMNACVAEHLSVADAGSIFKNTVADAVEANWHS